MSNTIATSQAPARKEMCWQPAPPFIVETLPGAAVQLRLTWTLVGSDQVQWRNECAVNGTPWFLVEEYLCTNV
jgi:hypothetical protein